MYRPRVLLAEDHAETAERLRKLLRATVHADLMLVEAGLAAGALGYILKDTAGDEFIPAVRAALGGDQYVSHEIDGFNRETKN